MSTYLTLLAEEFPDIYDFLIKLSERDKKKCNCDLDNNNVFQLCDNCTASKLLDDLEK